MDCWHQGTNFAPVAKTSVHKVRSSALPLCLHIKIWSPHSQGGLPHQANETRLLREVVSGQQVHSLRFWWNEHQDLEGQRIGKARQGSLKQMNEQREMALFMSLYLFHASYHLEIVFFILAVLFLYQLPLTPIMFFISAIQFMLVILRIFVLFVDFLHDICFISNTKWTWSNCYKHASFSSCFQFILLACMVESYYCKGSLKNLTWDHRSPQSFTLPLIMQPAFPTCFECTLPLHGGSVKPEDMCTWAWLITLWSLS